MSWKSENDAPMSLVVDKPKDYLDKAQAELAKASDKEAQGTETLKMAIAYFNMEDYYGALKSGKRASELLEGSTSVASGLAMLLLAKAAIELYKFADAETYVEKAFAALKGGAKGQAYALLAICQIYALSEPKKAIEQGTMAYKQLKDIKGAAVQAALAQLYIAVATNASSSSDADWKKFTDEALATFKKEGARSEEAKGMLVLSGMYLKNRNFDDAVKQAQAGLKAFGTIGDKKGVAVAYDALITAQIASGKLTAAMDSAKEMHGSASGDEMMLASAKLLIACVHTANETDKDYESALALAADARSIFKKGSAGVKEVQALDILVNICGKKGARKDKVEYANAKADLLNELGDKSGQAAQLMLVAQMQLAKGSAKQSSTAAEEALDIFRDENNAAGAVAAKNIMAQARAKVEKMQYDGSKAAQALKKWKDTGDPSDLFAGALALYQVRRGTK